MPTLIFDLLQTRIGVPPGTYPMNAARADLCEWLHLKGIPNSGAHSTERSSDYALRQAYAKPAYLAGWLRNIHGVEAVKSSARRRTEANLLLNQPTDNPDLSVLDSIDDVEDLENQDLAESITSELSIEDGMKSWTHSKPATDETGDAASATNLAKTLANSIGPVIRQVVADNIAQLRKEIDQKLSDQPAAMTKYINVELQSLEGNLLGKFDTLKSSVADEVKQRTDNVLSTFLHNIPSPAHDGQERNTDEPITESTAIVDIPSAAKSAADLIPSIDPDFYFDPDASRSLMTALKLNHNFYIQGPTGCGKTELVRQLHAKFRRPMFRINMHGDVTTANFLGVIDVKSGETFFKYGALPLAMQNGYLLLCDEYDYCPPHIAAILNPVLEHGGKLYIPDTGEFITPRSGFIVGATGNSGGKGDTNGQFTGIEVLNTANLDRFDCMMKMTYLPNVEEHKMLAKRFPNVSSDEIEKLIRLATETRNAFQRGELSVTLSTRKLITYFTWRLEGFSVNEALASVLGNWLDADDEALVRTLVDRLAVEK